jgi:hypothetical protein
MRIPFSASILGGFLALLTLPSVAMAQSGQVAVKFKPTSFEKDAKGSFVLANKATFESADDTLIPKARLALVAAIQRLQVPTGTNEWTVEYTQNSDELRFVFPVAQVKAKWKAGLLSCAGRWLEEQDIDTRSDFIMLTAPDASSDHAKLTKMSATLAAYVVSNPECVSGTEDLHAAGDAIQGRTTIYLDNRVNDFALPSRVAHLTKLYDESLDKVKNQVQVEIQSNALAFAKSWLDNLAHLGLSEDAGLSKTKELMSSNPRVSVTRFVAVGLTDLLGAEGVQKAFENLQGDQGYDVALQTASAAIDALAAGCAVTSNGLAISGQLCNDAFFAKLGWLTLSRNGKTSKFLLKP